MRRFALSPLGGLYSAVTFFRNKAFDVGLLKTERVPYPVVAVGNLTAGGTGKTPLVEYIVAFLLRRGKKVAVLSRGYGRLSRGPVVVSDGRSLLVDAAEGGDEAVQVARKFPGAVVIVSERRAVGALKAGEFGAEVIVLDDAFQHRYIHRDCNILVIDAAKDIRLELPLPAGRRREPLAGIRRADLIVWAGGGAGVKLEDLAHLVEPYFSGPMVRALVEVHRLVRAGSGGGEAEGVNELAAQRVLAFSGIGNPGRFAETVAGTGAELAGWVTFQDHHRYTEEDIQGLLETFRTSRAEMMVTTEKDAVRMMADREISENFLARFPVWFLPIQIRLSAGEEALHRMIEGVLPART